MDQHRNQVAFQSIVNRQSQSGPNLVPEFQFLGCWVPLMQLQQAKDRNRENAGEHGPQRVFC